VGFLAAIVAPVGSAAVEVEHLSVRYGDVIAVDDVSFAAAHGEITALLGPNGAGKTSTVEVCEGFRTAAAGAVRVLGLHPTQDRRALSARVGVMLQHGGVYSAARVGETVRHYCRLYGAGVDPAALIESVGLGAQVRTGWKRLSGGEQQRLSLALALAARPDVAFLDEPTAGVDIHGRDLVRAAIREMADRGAAVVLTTHELDEAERLADRVVIIDHGHLVADGPLDELRRGHEIRFRSSPDLDLAALAAAIGMIASRVGHDEYVIDAPPHPRLLAQLTGWLADSGHAVDDIRGGAQRLEDVIRRLTGGET
jgi:ABC-2 type transport system ATP-binding protein